MENNYNNAETDPRLLEILLDLKSDVQKVIKRGKDCENGNGKMITYDLLLSSSFDYCSKFR